MDRLEKNEYLYDRCLKAVSLPFRVKVEGDSTPANKLLSSDLPGVCLIGAQGLTAEITAVESGLSYAAVDANGTYAVFLKGSELGDVKEVYSVSLMRTLDGGTTTAALVSNGLTAGGNILIQIDATDALNSTDDSELYLEVKYCLK
jgi:hypothetical protein